MIVIQVANGILGAVTVIRLDPGEELLKGMEDACAQSGIYSGVILSGIGSLNGARFVDPVALPEKRAGYGYGDAITLNGPIELLGLSGTISRNAQGEPSFHAHYALSDQAGNAYGGHVLEGNTILLTAEIVIAQICSASMQRLYNPDLEVFTLALAQAGK